MNEVFENLSDSDQQQLLDRLVDGEIAGDEQRRLILSLEAHPDGWRRCALAFLESQAWGREFPQLTRIDSPAPTQPAANATRSAPRASMWLSRLAIATGFVLAFTLGLAARSTIQSDPREVALSPTGANGTAVGSADRHESNATATTVPHDASVETVKVSLPAGDGDSEQTLELPLIEADQQSLASLLAEQKPVLSELELKTLESTGHQVEQRRAYYPVQLQDGRQAVLPMDLVEVKYTGGWQ